MTDLTGKIALVTGSGQGVGRGIALALASAGARLALAGRTLEKVEAVAAEIADRGGEARAYALDVGDGDGITTTIATVAADFGGLNILVNNAQEVPLGPILDVDEASFNRGWETGPLAVFRMMRAAYPHLKGDGVIINLGTGAAMRADIEGLAVYASVKEAIRMMTRGAAVEWGEDGIRANVIIPLANSPGMDYWVKARPDDAATFMKLVPQRRVGDCEDDIGRVVAFLCSDDAKYITGQTLPIDGGMAFLR